MAHRPKRHFFLHKSKTFLGRTSRPLLVRTGAGGTGCRSGAGFVCCWGRVPTHWVARRDWEDRELILLLLEARLEYVRLLLEDDSRFKESDLWYQQ